MLCVGFLEEVIFRGLLFKAIARGNIRSAVIISINTIGTFANDKAVTAEMHIIHLAILIAITVAYTLVLIKTLPDNDQAPRAAD